MKREIHWLGAATILACIQLVHAAATESEFTTDSDWTTWSPRNEIAPNYQVVEKGGRSDDSALYLRTDASSDFGAWKRQYNDISPGKRYRFEGWYKTDGVQHEQRSIAPRLEWQDAKG